jgi:hypothetical protein
MAKPRFVLAEIKIRNFFAQLPKKVFSETQLKQILDDNRLTWQLGATHNLDRFIQNLENSKLVTPVSLNFFPISGDEQAVIKRTVKRYMTSSAGVLELALSLSSKSYLSHYTAAYLNGLTTQVPKRIYVTTELSKKQQTRGRLEQSAIDKAFRQPQRIAGEQAIWEDYTIIPLHGKFSNRLGVNLTAPMPHTGLERTLIDMAVRPAYSGGVHAVLEDYRKVVDKISINKLKATLTNLDLIYPYHQAIGFYLEKAGAPARKLEVFEEMAMEFDFYLTYDMKETAYSEKWRLYYPTGI